MDEFEELVELDVFVTLKVEGFHNGAKITEF